jgi:hypothetical protein
VYRIIFSLSPAEMLTVIEGRHPGMPGYPPDYLRKVVEGLLAQVTQDRGPGAGIARLEFLDNGIFHVLAAEGAEDPDDLHPSPSVS